MRNLTKLVMNVVYSLCGALFAVVLLVFLLVEGSEVVQLFALFALWSGFLSQFLAQSDDYRAAKWAMPFAVAGIVEATLAMVVYFVTL